MTNIDDDNNWDWFYKEENDKERDKGWCPIPLELPCDEDIVPPTTSSKDDNETTGDLNDNSIITIEL